MTVDRKPSIISNPVLKWTLEILNPLVRMQEAEQAMIRELEARNAIWGTDENGEPRQVTWVGDHFSLDGVPQNDENGEYIRTILDNCLQRMTK